jgi:hypothetical protein
MSSIRQVLLHCRQAANQRDDPDDEQDRWIEVNLVQMNDADDEPDHGADHHRDAGSDRRAAFQRLLLLGFPLVLDLFQVRNPPPRAGLVIVVALTPSGAIALVVVVVPPISPARAIIVIAPGAASGPIVLVVIPPITSAGTIIFI